MPASTHLRGLTAALTLSVGLFTVAACTNDDQPDEGSTGDPTSDGLTAPGSSLPLGDTATVPKNDGGGVVDITVTDIEEGDSSHLRTTGLKDAAHRTPYYIRLTLKVVSGNLQGFALHDYITAWAGDAPASPMLYAGDFPRCETHYWAPNPREGATMDACLPFLADEGDPPVDNVRFANDADYQLREDGFVTWG